MALDGLLLHQIKEELAQQLPCRINKIQSVSQEELLWTLRFANQTKRLLISLHSTYNRIHLSNASYTTLDTPGNFVMLLRKQLDGGFIRRIEQIGLDRILRIEIEARDELGDLHTHFLYAELMGKYANLILVNEENIITDALKRIPVFENSRRLIHPGARYTLPPKQEGRQDPFSIDGSQLKADVPLHAQLSGCSPLLGREIDYRLSQGEAYPAIIEQIRASHTLYLHDEQGKTQFHCIPLTHLHTTPNIYPLMQGMDVLFYEKEEKVRIKQQSGDLFRIIRRELNKNRNKLPKLYQALDEALDCERYREYGDLLFAYQSSIQKQPLITLPSFEREETVSIPLDMRFDIKQNANRYYQKYHKQRRAQSILQEQIERCEHQIRYFEQLEAQLELASVNDALEIREELAAQGYVKARVSGIRKKGKGKSVPGFLTFDMDGTLVYLGKNNLQNDYLTHRLAKKKDLWFHVKDLHGAHVICCNPQPDEALLRRCAMLAAYFSKGRYSGSVPVDYCFVQQLKKVPGAPLGFVSMQAHKTIYIDPDRQQVESWLTRYQKK